MGDHERDISGAAESANKRSKRKIEAALAAIGALLERGAIVDFQSVAVEANCSRMFLYKTPALRAKIEAIRSGIEEGTTPAPAGKDAQSAKIASLEYKIEKGKRESAELRANVELLRSLLQSALKRAEVIAHNPASYADMGDKCTNAEAERRLEAAVTVMKDHGIKISLLRLQSLTNLPMAKIKSFMRLESSVYQLIGDVMSTDVNKTFDPSAPWVPK